MHVQPQDLILNGTLLSRNCGMQLQVNATTFCKEVYEAKAVNYTFMVTALTLLQVHTKGPTCLFTPRSRFAQAACLNDLAAFHVMSFASSASKRSMNNFAALSVSIQPPSPQRPLSGALLYKCDV